MAEEQWGEGFAKVLGVFLNGAAIPTPGPHGERIVDDSFCLLFNAHDEAVDFTLPAFLNGGSRWDRVQDTSGAPPQQDGRDSSEQAISVAGRSLVVLSRPFEPEP